MIILGVDPGSNITGYGLVSGDVSRPVCLGFGAIHAKPKDSMAARLKLIYDGLREVISQARPDHMALEEAFFAKNAQSALKLGMARGVIMLAAQEQGVRVFEYSPLIIKQTVTGFGRADKEQVRTMVKIQLRMDKNPEPFDASDALATAITHMAHLGALSRESGQKR